jgi:hypothetical protein
MLTKGKHLATSQREFGEMFRFAQHDDETQNKNDRSAEG